MRYWIDIKKDNITFDYFQNEVNILYKAEYNWHHYISVKLKDIIDVLKENNLLKGYRMKKGKEIEGHYYMCWCGCFYKVVGGKQIRQPMQNLKNVNERNFHNAEFHKKHLKNVTLAETHGINKKKKKIKDKNMGAYSEKKLDKK